MRCQQTTPYAEQAGTPVWNQVGEYQIQTLEVPKSLQKELKLSPREWQALLLFSQGKSATKVARLMNISTNTADTYKRRTFIKLGVNSVAEAASLATAFVTGARVRKLTPENEIYITDHWSASNDNA